MSPVLIALQLYLLQAKVKGSICNIVIQMKINFSFERLGHIDIVKLLIEHGADVNASSRTNQNALVEATLNGHYEVIKYLIEHGADVKAKDNRNRSLLKIAKQAGLTNV